MQYLIPADKPTVRTALNVACILADSRDAKRGTSGETSPLEFHEEANTEPILFDDDNGALIERL